MKQKCQIQMGVGRYKNEATLLRTSGINATQQQFQMKCTTLIYLKGLKTYQPSYSKCVTPYEIMLKHIFMCFLCDNMKAKTRIFEY